MASNKGEAVQTSYVWAQRKLISVVLTCYWDFHKTGIDMSRAFDASTDPGCTDTSCETDDVRLIRILLVGTSITVRVKLS